MSVRLRKERFVGDSALEEEHDVEGPSSHFVAAVETEGASSSSCVCRGKRGRKVVELLTEAVVDNGLLMFIAGGASNGAQATLTFGY